MPDISSPTTPPKISTPTPPNVIAGTGGINWMKVVGLGVLGAAVVGGGIVAYLMLMNKPTESPTVTTKPSTTSAKPATGSAETSKWKTLTNNKLGFSIKYPNTVFVEVMADGRTNLATSKALLKRVGGPPMVIENVKNRGKTTAKDTLLYDYKHDLESLKYKEIRINNALGVSVTEYGGVSFSDGPKYYLASSDGSKIVEIGISPGPVSTAKEDLRIFELIVTTFKFL